MTEQAALELPEPKVDSSGSWTAPPTAQEALLGETEPLADIIKKGALEEIRQKQSEGEFPDAPSMDQGLEYHPPLDIDEVETGEVDTTADEVPGNVATTVDATLTELERVKAERDEALLNQRHSEEAHRMRAAAARDPVAFANHLLRSVGAAPAQPAATQTQPAPAQMQPSGDSWLRESVDEAAPAAQSASEQRLAALEAQISAMTEQAAQQQAAAALRSELESLKSKYPDVDSGAVLKHRNEKNLPSLSVAYKDLMFDQVLQARDTVASTKVKATKKVAGIGKSRKVSARKGASKVPKGLNRPDDDGNPLKAAAMEAMEAGAAQYGRRLDWKGPDLISADN